ncbi:hypothetical protein PHYPSEUDO_002765 [Phytophthora pseudosyringae]|uniref:Uncharacterized protein n=1 Tax=Phytophthora pseudosyringae TaxID=221518 RepID=A0A8T1VVU4_9STRA|nr:hypothetical protein PHYPSEUDO_002765 [Phytophthora pseudosyringae]
MDMTTRPHNQCAGLTERHHQGQHRTHSTPIIGVQCHAQHVLAAGLELPRGVSQQVAGKPFGVEKPVAMERALAAGRGTELTLGVGLLYSHWDMIVNRAAMIRLLGLVQGLQRARSSAPTKRIDTKFTLVACPALSLSLSLSLRRVPEMSELRMEWGA